MPTVAVVAFRLGLPDGVAIVAESWRRSFAELGYATVTVAGEGVADRIVTGLAPDAPDAGDAPAPPAVAELQAALEGVDIVVVENVLTFAVNLPASLALAGVLRGRPALLHHHDPPWLVPEHAGVTALPVDDPAWRHVVISRLTQAEFADRGIAATVIYNGFDVDAPTGDRLASRHRLGVAPDERLVLHPVRAIARKNVPAALALAEAIDATYWLPGPTEDGYAPTLEAVLAGARTRILRAPLAHHELADAHAAADAVLYPSLWEGFGMPPVEAAIFHRPVVVGNYPVAEELRALGFHWLAADDVDGLRTAIERPDAAALDADHALACRHFSQASMRAAISQVVTEAGWPVP